MGQRRTPKYIDGYGKTYALPTREKTADTAVVFVHGFGGKPTGTWLNFQSLVDEYSPDFPFWYSCDMFFYSYDSLHTPIRRNANLLGGFLGCVWSGSWMAGGSASAKYKRLLLVGHSEGGVVIRRLVLDRYEAIQMDVARRNPTANDQQLKAAIGQEIEGDYVLGSKLKLFAPACMGTNFSSWAGFFTSFSHLILAITSSFLVRNELLPNSPILGAIKSGTEEAFGNYRAVPSLYTRPVFGDHDQIVVSESYRGEEPLWDVGYDHFGVCKPNYTHKFPLEFVGK